jgi:cytidylate kinase
MIKICISGLTGSGKTTLGNLIAKELGIRHITKVQTHTYSVIASKLQAKNDRTLAIGQTANPKYAKDFDREIVAAARKSNCVVSTWLGPWLIKDASLRVWLNASLEERSRRKAKDLGTTLAKAKSYIIEKDSYAKSQFKKLYGIDINDHSIFDIEINTEKLNHADVVSVVSMLSMMKDKPKFV